MKPSPTLAPLSAAKKGGTTLRIAVWGLFILTAVVYGRICSHEFTWWDDDLTIHHNRRFDPPTAADVLWYWNHAEAGMYIPVVYTVWGWLGIIAYNTDRSDDGSHLNPAVYHYASLLAHIGTVLMVFVVLRRLFRKDWPAFAGAALYSVHPVQVETVAWATSLKEGLCGLFGMLSLWYYLRVATDDLPPIPSGKAQSPDPSPDAGSEVLRRAGSNAEESGSSEYLRTGVESASLDYESANAPAIAKPISRRRRVGLYVTSAVMLLLAQLSNPLAIVIPPFAFVLDAMVLRRPWRQATAWSGPLMALATVDAVICKIVQPGAMAPYTALWIRPLVATDTLAFYIFKLFWPWRLCTEYARRPDFALAHGWLYWTWVLPVAVAGIVWFFGRCRRLLIAGALIGLIGVAPMLGLIPFDLQQYSTPADRYLYLAMFGPVLLIAAWFTRPRAVWQRTAWGIVIAILAVKSFVQAGTWRDDMTLWKHTLAVSPNSFVAHSNLGADYNRLSDKPGPKSAWYLSVAMAEYKKAVELNPNFYKAHENLYLAYHRLGWMNEAIAEMKESVRLGDHLFGMRDRAEIRAMLAGVLVDQNRRAEAMVYLNQAKELDPNLPGLDRAFANAQNPPQTRPTTQPHS